jgi:transcriptional regulator with XRE-family HTH domain
MIGTSGDVVGRYERGDNSSSIEVVSKIADVLEVSVDYLICKLAWSLPQENKYIVLDPIDMALRDFKTKKAYAK